MIVNMDAHPPSKEEQMKFKRNISLLLLIYMIILVPFFVYEQITIKTQETKNKEVVKIVSVSNQEEIQKNREEAKQEVINYFQLAQQSYFVKMEELEYTTNKENWFLEYKEMLNEYSDFVDPPETIYDYFSNEDLDLLFHVVQAEIGDEYTFDQKVNVASVIFNRINSDEFGDTLSDILTKSQFSSISDGRYKKVEVSETTILACEFAFEIGDTTDGCLFFDSNKKLKYKFVYNDNAHNFYKK